MMLGPLYILLVLLLFLFALSCWCYSRVLLPLVLYFLVAFCVVFLPPRKMCVVLWIVMMLVRAPCIVSVLLCELVGLIRDGNNTATVDGCVVTIVLVVDAIRSFSGVRTFFAASLSMLSKILSEAFAYVAITMVMSCLLVVLLLSPIQ